MRSKISFLAVSTVLFALLTAASALSASTEKVLYSFCSVSNCTDGNGPRAGLVSNAAGNLYGTTAGGGANSSACSGFGCGTVFQLTRGEGGTWTEKVVYSFCSVSNCTDGALPYGTLIFDPAGNLYGTTIAGGAYSTNCFNGSCGTVFELSPNGNGTWTEKVLHSFNYDGQDGFRPYGSLTFDADGNLYGTTFYGGRFGAGSVFELTPGTDGTWTETVLHNFCGAHSCRKNGSQPFAGVVIGKKGDLYGTTFGGGYNPRPCHQNGCGVVFQLGMSANGKWQEKVLHTFTNHVNGDPQASLIFDAAGNLYGTGSDTVFELKKNDGWPERVLHKFGKGTDGAVLYANVVFDGAGNLYGTTFAGGDSKVGTIFRLARHGGGQWTEKIVHSFNNDGQDGTGPDASVIFDSAGNLYGTTSAGGTGPCKNSVGVVVGCGTVFEITP